MSFLTPINLVAPPGLVKDYLTIHSTFLFHGSHTTYSLSKHLWHQQHPRVFTAKGCVFEDKSVFLHCPQPHRLTVGHVYFVTQSLAQLFKK